jgi:hypothetical protein
MNAEIMKKYFSFLIDVFVFCLLITLFLNSCKKEEIVSNYNDEVEMIYSLIQGSNKDIDLTKEDIYEQLKKSKPVNRNPFLNFDKEHNCATEHSVEAPMYSYRSDLPIPDEIVIPVVFHVMHSNGLGNISTEQILSGLERLNNDFSETNFIFCLATEDPQGEPSSGIIRINVNDFYQNYTSIVITGNGCNGGVSDSDIKNLSLWPKTHAMSVYIVPQINCSNGTFGYFTGTNFNSLGSVYDAIVIRYDRIGSVPFVVNGNTFFNNVAGGTFTHEVGHYFNLRHPWGSSTNPSLNCNGLENPISCGGGPSLDFVCDTPPTSGPRSVNCGPGQGCPDALIGNYMDYDTQCYDHFTPGQIQRMHESMFSPSRSGLLNSNGAACSSPSCLWDLDNDGLVSINDLLILLSQWGNPYSVNDLLDILSEFGIEC